MKERARRVGEHLKISDTYTQFVTHQLIEVFQCLYTSHYQSMFYLLGYITYILFYLSIGPDHVDLPMYRIS